MKFRLRTRHRRGLQAAHADRDEAVGRGVHEPTEGNQKKASEAVVNSGPALGAARQPTQEPATPARPQYSLRPFVYLAWTP